MKVNVESVSSVEKKVSVEVEADRVTQALERAYRVLSRQVKVPGFRQGKVPRRILEARFRDQVEQDVVQDLVAETYDQVVAKEKLEPVALPSIAPERLEAGKEFRYEARVEVKPKVVVQDYKGLQYEAVEPADVDAGVEAELERLREQAAQMIPVERTTATTGDYAMIDYEGFLGDEPIEGAKGEGITVKVEEGTLLEGKAPMLAGVPVGEAVDAMVDFPEDYGVESLRGKTGRFRVTLHGLRQREIPALDDEFAKDLDRGVDSLEALRAQIRELAEKREADRLLGEQRRRVLAVLGEKNPFEIPNSMIERAIDMQISEMVERLAQQGIDARQLGLDFGQMREGFREEATRRVRSSLLLDAVAEQEGIEVGEEDLGAHFKKLVEEFNLPEETIRGHFERDPKAKRNLSATLREEKALALLLAEAKVSS